MSAMQKEKLSTHKHANQNQIQYAEEWEFFYGKPFGDFYVFRDVVRWLFYILC